MIEPEIITTKSGLTATVYCGELRALATRNLCRACGAQTDVEDATNEAAAQPRNLEPKYFDIAKRRIAAEAAQGKMF